MPHNQEPDLVLIISGKRKSGKDYVFAKLSEYLKQCSKSKPLVSKQVILSSQLKKAYAQEHQLDYQRLLDSSSYKETYRLDMIRYRTEAWKFAQLITNENSSFK